MQPRISKRHAQAELELPPEGPGVSGAGCLCMTINLGSVHLYNGSIVSSVDSLSIRSLPSATLCCGPFSRMQYLHQNSIVTTLLPRLDALQTGVQALSQWSGPHCIEAGVRCQSRLRFDGFA